MNGSESRERLPLVAVVSGVPILGEALSEVLEDIAQVRSFPAGRGDTAGLLRWLRPDAVVVDSEEEASAAAGFAQETGSTLVHVLFREEKLRVLTDEAWEEPEHDSVTPEAIRNILVGGMFGRKRSEVGQR